MKNFHLDTIKRDFSNSNFDDFIERFWSEYDPESYSIYISEYNYNNENTVYFMVCNLISGYIQRLDNCRKYAFGSLNIGGPDDGPYTITGCWIFKGNEIPKEIMECSDSEYYTWTRIDPSTDEGKNRVKEMWQGEKCHEVKYFK